MQEAYYSMWSHIFPTYIQMVIADPDFRDAEIKPEMGDNYLSTKLILPKGDALVKDRVTMQKRSE